MRVPHDNHERYVQVFGRVLDTGRLVVAGDVAGHADGEDVAESFVEDDLGRHARVGARENGAVRGLAGRQHVLTVRRLVWMQILLGDVVRVPRLEFGEHRISGWHRFLRSQRQGTDGNERDRVHPSHSDSLPARGFFVTAYVSFCL
jgi:hypothetical protein